MQLASGESPKFLQPLRERRILESRSQQPGRCDKSTEHPPTEEHILLNPLDDPIAVRTVRNALPEFLLFNPALCCPLALSV